MASISGKLHRKVGLANIMSENFGIGGKVNALEDYLKIANEQYLSKKVGNLHLGNNGNLYVAESRGKFNTLITKIVATLMELFVNTDCHAKMKIADDARKKLAADEFISLVADKMHTHMEPPMRISRDIFGPPESYRQFLENNVPQHRSFIKLLIDEDVWGVKFKPGGLGGENTIAMLKEHGVHADRLGGEERKTFAEVYNSILNSKIAKLTELAGQQQILSLMEGDVELFRLLVDNPHLSSKLVNYFKATESSFLNLYSGYVRKKPDLLARSKVEMCCVHNGFMRENAGTLGCRTGSEQEKFLMRCGVEKAISGISSTRHGKETLQKFLHANFQPMLTKFTQKAHLAIKSIPSLDLENIIHLDKFENYSARSNVNSVAELIDLEALKLMDGICEEKREENLEIFFDLLFANSKGEITDMQDLLKQVVKKYIDNY